MKRAILIAAVLFGIVNGIAGVKEVLLKKGKRAAHIRDLIPRGHAIKDSLVYDVNGDGLKDEILVLCDKRETSPAYSMNDELKRKLLILFAVNNGWEVAAVSDEVVMCRACGGMFGDPYQGIEQKNGVLVVSNYGGASTKWAYTREFAFKNGDFYLVHTTDAYVHLSDCDQGNEIPGMSEEKDLVTGNVWRKEVSDECKVVLDTQYKEKVKPLVKLADYKYEN